MPHPRHLDDRVPLSTAWRSTDVAEPYQDYGDHGDCK